uniref:Uncharacterized protein n=1 Tax=Anguilla anguilla TaxID=7936 RepID=A0A0E9PDU5_ANGAN
MFRRSFWCLPVHCIEPHRSP